MHRVAGLLAAFLLAGCATTGATGRPAGPMPRGDGEPARYELSLGGGRLAAVVDLDTRAVFLDESVLASDSMVGPAGVWWIVVQRWMPTDQASLQGILDGLLVHLAAGGADGGLASAGGVRIEYVDPRMLDDQSDTGIRADLVKALLGETAAIPELSLVRREP